MTQNIYDNQAFYAGYSELPRSVEGLWGAPEWETVKAFLPDLNKSRILDLGCGFGAFDRWAVEQGATSVLGIDLSQNMLNRARELTKSDNVEYRIGDLAKLDICESGFDLIYSALAFHYIKDFHSLCGEMRSKLVQGGRLIATVEHPIFTAPQRGEWQKTGESGLIWPLEGYFKEGRRERSWIAEGVEKYHRTLETYITALLANSFSIKGLKEWQPSSAQLKLHPEWTSELERPTFLIFSAEAV